MWHGMIRPREKQIQKFEAKVGELRAENSGNELLKKANLLRIKGACKIALDRVGEDDPGKRKEIIGKIQALLGEGDAIDAEATRRHFEKQEMKLIEELGKRWGNEGVEVFLSKYFDALSKLDRQHQEKVQVKPRIRGTPE